MPQQINKKIFLILVILFILGTFSNKNIGNTSFLKNGNFKIKDLSNFENKKLRQDLSKLKNQNLFFLSKEKVLAILNSNKIVESSYIFKKYPTHLNVKIWKTNFLAITKNEGKDYYIGSNGNLIKVEDEKIDLPFIFGDIEISEFLKLKKIMNDFNFNYQSIQNLYYFKSKRWDLETKEGLLIRLPSKNLEKSFKILLNILNDADLNNFTNIDLRNNNQVIISG